MLQDDDLIDVVNRREPMRDDESGSAVHQFFDRLHDGRLGRGIERGSWFVEEKNRRVFEKGARDADALALADAEMPAAFAHRAVISVAACG